MCPTRANDALCTSYIIWNNGLSEPEAKGLRVYKEGKQNWLQKDICK